MDGIEEALKGTKLTPTQRQEIIEANKSLMRDMAGRVRARNHAQLQRQYSPMMLTGLAAGGGAVAELTRRNLVGRLTKDPRAQGVGLIVVGGVVCWLGKRIAYLGPIGAAHAAVGGAVLAASFHGSDEKEDPVKFALQETTYKAKHPAKADKKA